MGCFSSKNYTVKDKTDKNEDTTHQHKPKEDCQSDINTRMTNIIQAIADEREERKEEFATLSQQFA